MDKSKAKEFVKEHKKVIAVGAGVVLGTITWMVVRKSFCSSKQISLPTIENKIKNIIVPDTFSVGKVIDLFEDGDEIVTIARELTVNDLGRFGKELVKHGLVADGAEAAITAEFLKNV